MDALGRREFRHILGQRQTPPLLFIRGRYAAVAAATV